MPLFAYTKTFIRNLFRRDRADGDIDEELRSYLELLTEEKIASGLSPHEARRDAMIELGGLTQVKENVRDIQAGTYLDSAAQDIRFALRTLSRAPAFTAIAILTLALGIGATTAIFSVFNAVLLKPLPIHEPERVVALHDQFFSFDNPRTKVSPLQFREFSQHIDIFESTAAFKPVGLTLTTTDRAQHIQAMKATSGFFTLLGTEPLCGRSFTQADDTFGSPHVVILGDALWQNLFGRDPKAIGKTLRLDGSTYEIVGVMPSRLNDIFFPHPDVWIPAAIDPDSATEKYRWYVDYSMLARLRDGVTIEQSRAVMQAAVAEFNDTDFKFGVEVRPIVDEKVGDIRKPLNILLGAVFLVLLIASLNVANLLLSRNAARKQEIATRTSLGAPRSRLIAQLLAESLMVSLGGGMLGVALARIGVTAITRFAPPDIPGFTSVPLDGVILIFALALSVAASLLCGLGPAIFSTRFDPAETLKVGVRTGGDRHTESFSRILVVAEIAVSLVLLAGSGVLLRSFQSLLNVPIGFDQQGVLTARLSLPPAITNNITPFSKLAIERLASVPGITHAAIATGAPFSSDGYSTTFDIRDRHESPSDPMPHAAVLYVTPEYFDTLKIPLIAGRVFGEGDMRQANWLGPGAVRIIDEALATRLFQDRNPIGAQIGNDGKWATIVGVVGTVRDGDLATEPLGTLYIPGYAGSTVIVRTAANPLTVVSSVSEALHVLSGDVAIYDVEPMSQLVSHSLARQRFATTLLGQFAATAFVLAFVGVYSVTAYRTTKRIHEIGLRIALGAQHRDILHLALGNGSLVALLGIAIGFAGSLALRPLLANLLYGVGPTDSLTLISVGLLLLAATLIATYIPARRAAKVDPMQTLRHD
ncbi:MAG: ABC transporter permease [Acidobacteria bacterium]|nr:ABC transporter permease [Acidobacteriota bacterium]